MARGLPSGASYSFGPGHVTPAIRALIAANVVVYLLTFLSPDAVITTFGLTPRIVVHQGYLWQLATYLFLHSPSSVWHILFNMLALWMFGVELEERWGARAFVIYYFVTGIGAGVCSVIVALLPFAGARLAYDVPTIGASGAIYGVLLAWAMVFPNRQVLAMMIFPMSSRLFVILMGAIALFTAFSATGNGVANVAHLGGLLVGWIYLKGPRDLQAELSYRLTRWRMDRLRRRFDVHRGGRNDWERHIH